MRRRFRCSLGRLEKLIYIGVWTLALVCLVGESLYLLYLGYMNPRAELISQFDEVVREWNYTTRAQLQALELYAGEKEFEVLLAQASEVHLEGTDQEAQWYLPLHYTGALNSSDLAASEFSYTTNVTIHIRAVNQTSTSTWEMVTESLPTVIALKEEVTEATCAKHQGFHDPVFGWCMSFLKLQGICVTIQFEGQQWRLDPARAGCYGKNLDELPLYERMPVPLGTETPSLPIPATSLVVTVRSSSDPLFAAYDTTSGSFDFGVRDTVYKVVGVSLLGVSLVLLVHPICYFSRKYRDWRRVAHKHFVDPVDDSKPPSRVEGSF